MKNINQIIIASALFLCGVIDANAAIMSESVIKDLAKSLEQRSNGRFECHAEQRTLVFDVYLPDNSYLKDFDKDKIINNVSEDMAALCATNFITTRYDIHYFDNAGIERKKQVYLGMLDILNLKSETREMFSTKNLPKAYGVNLTMPKPKGWTKRTGNEAPIVQKLEVIQGENYASYIIQMNQIPTVISKQDAKEIFNGKEKYGITLHQLKARLLAGIANAQIKSVSEDNVGNYPAYKVEYTCYTTKQGVTAYLYGIAWMIFHEDVFITLYGNANTNNTNEMSMYGLLFNLITNNVHFYD